MDTDVKDPQTHAIIGAAMEVHRTLGCGFLEAVYQEALAIELESRSIPFAPQVELAIEYKGRKLGCAYRADLICFDSVIVELKAVSEIGVIEQAQVLNYLKATAIERGLILNFAKTKLEFRRLVRSTHLR